MLSIKNTENGGAQAVLKIDFGTLDMDAFDNDFSFHPDKFDDADCCHLGCQLVRSAFVGGWAVILSKSLAKNLDLEVSNPYLIGRVGLTGPDHAIAQD